MNCFTALLALTLATVSFAASPVPSGLLCSTGGGLVPPSPFPCGRHATCVIFDFGFPAVDRPNRGVCKKLPGPPPKCSVEFCSKTGAKGICSVAEGNADVAFCGSWATRSDGFPGPDCDFVCLAVCLEDGPFGSDGKQYCSLCYLRAASCASNFKIYGPVPKPH